MGHGAGQGGALVTRARRVRAALEALGMWGSSAPADVAVGMNPADVPWMRSVWDAYEGATWDGSNLLASIADTGPDGNDMAPDVVGLPQDPYIVGADTAAVLPGTSANWQHTPEAPLNETVTAFTMFAIIPAQVKPSANRVYAAMLTDSAGGYFALQIAGSVTPGAVNIVTPAGTQATVQLGLGAAGVQDGAHAILGIRRSGTVMVLDVWYDLKDGNGLHGPTRTVVASTMAASVLCKGFALGGRAAITQYWNGSPIHLLAWADAFVPNEYMEAMAAWAGARLDVEIDEPVFAEALGVKPTAGGNQLYDPATSAEYATDADGFYIDSEGNRLTVDAGYGAGDAVGAPVPEGMPSATVVGDPSNGGRLVGFLASTSDYVKTTLDHGKWGFIAHTAKTSGIFDVLFGIKAVGSNRALLNKAGTADTIRLLADDGTLGITSASIAIAVGAECYIGGAYDGTDTGRRSIVAMDAAGADLDAAEDDPGTPVVDLTGQEVWLGMHPDSALHAWAQVVEQFVVWVGTAPTLVTLRLVAADIIAGTDPADIISTHGAIIVSRGMICGAIDGTDATALPYIGAVGDGTPAVVALG